MTGGSKRQLYGAGGEVYIPTRSRERTESAILKIKKYYGAEDAKKQRGSLEFIPMDLILLQVREGSSSADP